MSLNLSPDDLMKRARIQIMKGNSFFSYLALYIQFKEDKKGEIPDWAGMGIDAKGNLIYKPMYVKGLADKELQGVFLHETLHLAFLHLIRVGTKNPELWNIVTDIAVNQIIKDSGYTLPKNTLLSNHKNEITLCNQVVKDCNKKSAEMIYDELKTNQQLMDMVKQMAQKGFDVHMESDEGQTPQETEELSKEWSDRLREALAISKMRGDLPEGMERFVEDLHKEKINWRELLQRYIVNSLPYDFTFAKPHKKSIATGFYMPSVLKEKLDISVLIDVSGSVGQEELTDFLSEIVGIANAFKDRISMRILTHECEILDDYYVDDANMGNILELKIKGGGGTSFNPSLDYINEKHPETKLLVWLTDGYAEKIEEDKVTFDLLWVLSNGGNEDSIKHIGKIMKLD
jgi:predicted metal-dependent peptidase